jgi:hypothetical protein
MTNGSQNAGNRFALEQISQALADVPLAGGLAIGFD